MPKITNTENYQSREASIITTHDNKLNWCIAVWPAPQYGRTEVTGHGVGFQVVKANKNGSYVYNSTMFSCFFNNLEDAKSFAAEKGYTLKDL